MATLPTDAELRDPAFIAWSLQLAKVPRTARGVAYAYNYAPSGGAAYQAALEGFANSLPVQEYSLAYQIHQPAVVIP